MKQGIIFDMDGTLWDSAKNVAISWDKVVKQEAGGFRSITIEDIQGVMGHTMTEIAELLFFDFGEKEALSLMEKCCQAENEYLREHGGILYPQLEATLAELAEQYPLFIVSNCQSGYIEAFLDYYGFWQYFKDIECFGNNQCSKGENIALIIKRNQLDHAVYVGDIQGDYNASKLAGAKFIHASYGFGTIDEKVPFIREFRELPQVVSQVLSTGNNKKGD